MNEENNRQGHATDARPGTQANTATEMTQVPDTARTIGGWMIILCWVIVLGAGTWTAQRWLNERAMARDGLWVSNESGQQSLLLKSNRFGQYRVKGSANGQEVLFLVDTGASGVSIPQNIATRLGLQRGKPFQVSTANGVTTVYTTSLNSLSIGPLSRRNVDAHINPSMDGNLALLGMSFLRHYELVQRAGELTISNP